MPKYGFMPAGLSLQEYYQQQGLRFFYNWWACEIGDLTLIPGADYSTWRAPAGRFHPAHQRIYVYELHTTIDTPYESDRAAEPDKWPVRIWQRTA